MNFLFFSKAYQFFLTKKYNISVANGVETSYLIFHYRFRYYKSDISSRLQHSLRYRQFQRGLKPLD